MNPNPPQNEEWKKKLISIRNGAMITPVLNEIIFEISKSHQEGRDGLLKELSITKDLGLAEWRRAYKKGQQETLDKILEMAEKMNKDDFGGNTHFLKETCRWCGCRETEYHINPCKTLTKEIYNQALSDLRNQVEKMK